MMYVNGQKPKFSVSEDGMLTFFNSTEYVKPISIDSRRYIGNKAKLTGWIFPTIANEASGCTSFCDIFAGTGVVASRAQRVYSRVIVNDFLHSNNVIYRAFFGKGEWSRSTICRLLDEYNGLQSDQLPDNYFSRNFGGKFFELGLARLIGHIRQDIEDRRSTLTPKEYAILLTTLIYNIDRLANTVGHFDAYLKKPIAPHPLELRLIDAHTCDNVEIFRADANELATRIKSDIVYIDPPYNSRQYCRFYHVYETLVKWDFPRLYGTALKPAPENMSRYCTTRAREAFEHLVCNLDTRYLAVSYNNTYHSKSKSSENKIRLDDLRSILELCGDTQVYEHAYSAFNTGKTHFEDHKELLFITKVDDERKRKSFSALLRGR